MQRQIKFRAWDFVDNEMILNDELNFSEISPIMEYEDMNFMQFTGLLDKNGVEIFESDLVNAYDFKSCEVVYMEDKVCYMIKTNPLENYYSFLPDSSDIEVIGNIYEDKG